MWISLLLAVTSAAPDAGLESRAGFSRDESQFAHVVYSEPAGLHLFIVLDTASGEQREKIPLSDEAARARAERYWTSGGFDQQPRKMAGAKVSAVKGKLLLEQGGKVRELRDPFAFQGVGLGGPLGPTVWGASPSGRILAVKVDRDAGTHFGTATSFTFAAFDAAKRERR